MIGVMKPKIDTIKPGVLWDDDVFDMMIASTTHTNTVTAKAAMAAVIAVLRNDDPSALDNGCLGIWRIK